MTTANSFMIREWTEGLDDKKRIKIIELFESVESNRNSMRQKCSYLNEQLTIKTSECEKLREFFLLIKHHPEVRAIWTKDTIKQCLNELTELSKQGDG